MREQNNDTPVDTNGKMETEKKGKDSSKVIDYDQLLSSAGEFGCYQVLFILASCPFYVIGAFSYFVQLFMTEVSANHWCWIPELANLTVTERRSLAIPNDTNARYGYSQCSSYVANWTEVLATGASPDVTWTTGACQHGWEFDKSEIPYPTISSELGWVCDKSNYRATAQSMNFIGSLIGGLFFGWICDRYGRIPTTVYCNVIGAIAGIGSMFVTDFIQFAVCRFIYGLAYDTCWCMVYLLLLEYVAPKYRAFVANAPMGLFYTLGAVSLPWVALACGHWKTLSLVTSIPMALVTLTPFVLPESPRWLLSKGRVDETVEKVKTIAKVNKKQIPEKLIEDFKANAKDEIQEQGSMLDLMKRPLLRTVFLCACLLYTCNVIVFDAMVRTLGILEFDFFLSFTLVSLTELPALLINAVILDWTGRKWMNLVCLSLSGTLCILIIFVGPGWPSLTCSILCRFAVNMSMTAATQWSIEVLPTFVRGSGNSIIHMCGFIGAVISPFIAYLSEYIIWLPMVVIAAIAFLGAAVCLKIPETARKELPQTFADAEKLVKESSIFEYPWRNSDTVDQGHTNTAFDLNEL
ncbi:sugar transporter domain-containing protein [Phthorimaea operculella]|nr:sugar transporter domain-containing protein [Phthorimaea operculella]